MLSGLAETQRCATSAVLTAYRFSGCTNVSGTHSCNSFMKHRIVCVLTSTRKPSLTSLNGRQRAISLISLRFLVCWMLWCSMLMVLHCMNRPPFKLEVGGFPHQNQLNMSLSRSAVSGMQWAYAYNAIPETTPQTPSSWTYSRSPSSGWESPMVPPEPETVPLPAIPPDPAELPMTWLEETWDCHPDGPSTPTYSDYGISNMEELERELAVYAAQDATRRRAENAWRRLVRRTCTSRVCTTMVHWTLPAWGRIVRNLCPSVNRWRILIYQYQRLRSRLRLQFELEWFLRRVINYHLCDRIRELETPIATPDVTASEVTAWTRVWWAVEAQERNAYIDSHMC